MSWFNVKLQLKLPKVGAEAGVKVKAIVKAIVKAEI